jgi:hypothetical protein
MVIKGNYIVKKLNVLNEFRAQNMNLEELRLFSIYLSKINPADISTRKVIFPLTAFQKIMKIGKIHPNYIRAIAENMLTKVVSVPTGKRGEFNAFQLFKNFKLQSSEPDDKIEDWYVEMDAHDDALPLMFEFKDKYFSKRLFKIS